MSENIISAEVQSLPNLAHQAARALQRLGFRILHIGPTISVEGPQLLWESTFNVSFESQQTSVIAEVEGSEAIYQKPREEEISIPQELQKLIAEVTFVTPPEFF